MTSTAIAVALGLAGCAFSSPAPRAPVAPTVQKAAAMIRATGAFDVSLSPLALHVETEPSLGRMALAKTFHGELEAKSVGEMLTVRADKGSAVYVAVERVVGTLAGRTGSFALHHTGVMTSSGRQLAISIVPDSGTDGLAGIAGTLGIRIVDGKHFYDLDYTLPAP